MTPLLGTKTPSALVDKSGGDRRAARSLPSCALWRGMGRLWRGMGGRRPPRRQHGLYAFHESQLHYPRFPTISRYFPRFPGISQVPPPALQARIGCETKFRARLESGRAGASRTSYSRPLFRWERVGVRVRSMARMVHRGTEALQSFFSASAWIAWHGEEKILPCFRIRQQGECVRNTRSESRLFSPSGPPCPPSSHGFPIHCCPLLPTIARFFCRQAAAAYNGALLPGFLAAKLLLPAMARHFPAFLPPVHGLPAHGSPLLPTSCPRLPMSARYCLLQSLPAASLRTVSDFRAELT